MLLGALQGAQTELVKFARQPQLRRQHAGALPGLRDAGEGRRGGEQGDEGAAGGSRCLRRKDP